MAFLLQRGVRERLVVAALTAVVSVILKFLVAVAAWEDPWKTGANTLIDALTLIVIGIVVASYLDQRATERERRKRARARAARLDQLGPSLKLAASGWVHRPGHSAPEDEDFSVPAGLAAIEEESQRLEKIELRMKKTHEERLSTTFYCMQVAYLAFHYWFEGGRPSRFSHLTGLRQSLEAEVVDAGDDVRRCFNLFAGALDLTEASRHKTNAVIQERLVAGLVAPRHPTAIHGYGDETHAVIRSIADVAQPMDSVLHLVLAAGALRDRAEKLQATSEGPKQGASAASIEDDVYGMLNRCIKAVEHEVANVRITLLRLSQFVVALEQEAGS